MRWFLLRPLLGLAVAMMVVTVGAWSIETEQTGSAELASPDLAAPVKVIRVGRLPDGRNGASGPMSSPLVGLAPGAAPPASPEPAVRMGAQARPCLGGRILSADRTSRGPPTI